MDLQQAGGSAIQDYGNALTNLQNQDAQNRAFINARQDRYLRSTQQAPSDTVQTAATGTPDSGQLPASPDTSAPVAPQTAITAQDSSAPAADNNSNAIMVSESNRRLQAMRNAAAAPAGPSQTVASGGPPTDLARLQALQRASGSTWGAGPMDAPASQPQQANKSQPAVPQANMRPTTGQITDEAVRLKGLQSQDVGSGTSVASRNNNPGNLVFAGQAGATPSPTVNSDGTRFAVFQTPETGAQAAQQDLAGKIARGNNTVQSLIHTWAGSQYAGNTPASEQNYVARVSQALGVDPNQPLTPAHIPALSQAMFAVESGGSGKVAAKPATAQPTAAQPAAPQGQPTQQGPKFTAADGTPFTVPQQYNDGQIQQMQQQAAQIKNAMQLAWLHYQNGTSPDNSQVMQLQQAGQQLNQHLYDADIYAKTQQAQAGNPTAFSALLNEYSNKVGQPIQVVPEGNGVYSLRAKGGQVIAHGDPASLAGTLGGVLNSAARAYNMHLQQMEAESGATERGKANAMLPTEMAKLQTELAKQMGVNASDQIVAKIKTGELKVTTNINGQFLITDPATGKSTLLDPSKPNSIGAPTPYHQNLP